MALYCLHRRPPVCELLSVETIAVQLAVAFAVGSASGIGKKTTHTEVASLGARAAFVVGAAMMLFSESRWWPVGRSIFLLAVSVAAARLVTRISYHVALRLMKCLR